jgi:hypothetical protein
MNDEKWLELASEYIEGTLHPEMHEKVRVYLTENKQAQKEEQELRGILQELGTMPEVDPPMFFRENLMKALEAQTKAAQEKKPWWQLTRFMQGSLVVGGAFAALTLGILLPQLNNQPGEGNMAEASLGKSLAPPTMTGSALPEAIVNATNTANTTPAQIRVTQGILKDKNRYEFALTLSQSKSAFVRIEVPGREAQVATLNENATQAIQVEPDANASVLHLGIRWTSAGNSQEKQFYLPTGAGTAKPTWSNPGEGSTLDKALMNLVAYYGKPVTVENVDTHAVRVPTLVQEAGLQQTLSERLAPMGLIVTQSNDGVIITHATK